MTHAHTFTKRTPASSVLTCHCGAFRHVDPNPAIVEIPATGTLDELEPGLRAAGYTHVETMGGRIDLSTFDPYGMRRVGSVNIQSERWADHVWRGRLAYVDGRPYLTDARTPAPDSPFLSGFFPLV